MDVASGTNLPQKPARNKTTVTHQTETHIVYVWSPGLLWSPSSFCLSRDCFTSSLHGCIGSLNLFNFSGYPPLSEPEPESVPLSLSHSLYSPPLASENQLRRKYRSVRGEEKGRETWTGTSPGTRNRGVGTRRRNAMIVDAQSFELVIFLFLLNPSPPLSDSPHFHSFLARSLSRSLALSTPANPPFMFIV